MAFFGGAATLSALQAFTDADVAPGLMGIVTSTGERYLCTAANGSGSTWQAISQDAANLLWESVYFRDLAAEANQSPSGGNLTVGGVTYYGRNLAQAGTAAIVNGTGLVIDTTGGAGGSTIELFQAATDGPRFEVNLDDIYSWSPTDMVSLALDCVFSFTNASNQFSFAGAVLGWVLASGAVLGTATTYHVQTLRGLAANVQSGWIRANGSAVGGELLAQRTSTPDQDLTSSVRVDVLGSMGFLSEHYNGDAYSGVWPTWQTLFSTRPSLNSNNAHVVQVASPLTTPARLRAMIYAGRAGSASQQARIECKRIEVFRIRRPY